MPQDHVLFSRTIRENILFGKEDATQAELQQAIRAAYFEKDLENLPMGLETLVGEKVYLFQAVKNNVYLLLVH